MTAAAYLSSEVRSFLMCSTYQSMASTYLRYTSGIGSATTGGLVFFSSGMGGSSSFFAFFIWSMISS